MSWLFALALIVGMAGVHALVRASRVASWAILGILGTTFIVMIPFIEMRPFSWAKVITLLVCVAVMNAARSTRWGQHLSAQIVFWFLLALNILEAVAQDASDGSYVNAALGLGLVLSLGGWGRISVSEGQINWRMTLPWVLAYTFWNMAFVARFYPIHFTDHLAILGVPLAWVALHRHSWFQARGYVLAIYALVIVVWIDASGLYWPDSAIEPSPPLVYALVAAGVVSLVMHVIVELVARFRHQPVSAADG